MKHGVRLAYVATLDREWTHCDLPAVPPVSALSSLSMSRDLTARKGAQQHRTLENALEVARLRHEKGMSYRNIGVELGMTHTWARALYLKWLEQQHKEIKAEGKLLVVAELRKLDNLWELNYTRATDPSIDVAEQQAATDRCLKISDRRRALLGLDAPERMEITGAEGGPIIFQQVQELDDKALDDELAGFFNPGYMEGAADGYARGVADGKKQARKRPNAKAKSVPKDVEPVPSPPSRPRRGEDGEAKVGGRTVVLDMPSAGRARI